MSDELDLKTPDAALSEQAEPVPPITFQFSGKTVTLAVPFTKPVWFWILTHSSDSLDPNESADSLFKSLGQCVALEAERILSVATQIPLDKLTAGREAEELRRVLREVAEQLGREMIAASPFTHFRDALEAVNRLALLARGAKGSSGPQPSLQSKPNSAAGPRRRRRT
jgi:hypothetical protein